MWWRFKTPKLEILFGTPVFSARRDRRYLRTKMLSQSLAELPPTAGYPELAEKEISLTVNHPYNSAKRTRERSKLDQETMAREDYGQGPSWGSQCSSC
jgi:hypothetical protein